jgi:U6 snRNA-associated Sm-like protein LSm7
VVPHRPPLSCARPSGREATTMSRKESALDLAKFIDKGVRVKLAGGREGEKQSAAPLSCYVARPARPHAPSFPSHTPTPSTVAGVLKGYDQLLNLVLDEAREFLRGALTHFVKRPSTSAGRRAAARRSNVTPLNPTPHPSPPHHNPHPHTHTNNRPGGPLAHHRPHAQPRPDRVPRHGRHGRLADAWRRGGGQPVRGTRSRGGSGRMMRSSCAWTKSWTGPRLCSRGWVG